MISYQHAVQIDNVKDVVTIDALHALFSAYGTVQKIALVDRPAASTTRVALVQYADTGAAAVALGTLQGHCMHGKDAHKVGVVEDA